MTRNLNASNSYWNHLNSEFDLSLNQIKMIQWYNFMCQWRSETEKRETNLNDPLRNLFSRDEWMFSFRSPAKNGLSVAQHIIIFATKYYTHDVRKAIFKLVKSSSVYFQHWQIEVKVKKTNERKETLNSESNLWRGKTIMPCSIKALFSVNFKSIKCHFLIGAD